MDPASLKGRLNVTFDGEEAVDAGGVTREWCSPMQGAIGGSRKGQHRKPVQFGPGLEYGAP